MTYCYKDDPKIDQNADRKPLKGEGKAFSSMDEAVYAYDMGYVEIHAPIKVRISIYDESKEDEVEVDKDGNYIDPLKYQMVETTVGRIMLYKAIPGEFRPGSQARSNIHPREKITFASLNKTIGKKQLVKFVSGFHFKFKNKFTAYLLDNVKKLGFTFATKSGSTVSIVDVEVPPQKPEILKESDQKIHKIEEYFLQGWTTPEERDDQIIAVWHDASKRVERAMMDNLSSLNSIYMMATSGARGNTSQVKQLAGMRGLMSSASGKTIPLPIKANLREGLSVLEYFISTHGARKGLADTALRTADSGYLTRRLIDVSQDIIIRDWDCQRRLICQNCGEENYYGNLQCDNCNTLIDYNIEENHKNIGGEYIQVECYRDTDDLDSPCLLFERIRGRVVAQDILNPETSEVLITEGTLVSDEQAEEISSIYEKYIRARWQEYIDKNKEAVEEDEGRESARFMRSLPDEKKLMNIRSVLTCKTRYGVCSTCYGRNMATGDLVEIGEAVGTIAAQSIGELRTFHTGGVAEADIIQGLPRVEELFEARKPKRYGYIAEIEGAIRFDTEKGLRKVIIENPQTKDSWDVNIPFSTRLKVNEGDYVKAGTMLTEGSKNPHDILRVQGVNEVQRYLVDEAQEVYKSQGVDINDKHFEIIVKQMLRKAKVETAGDTDFLPGILVDIFQLEEENARMVAEGKEPTTYKPTLLGVTKASLATDSFLSAASFQETTRVLTEAAIKGKIDNLVGLKENVIIGKMIPAGTGLQRYKSINIRLRDGEQIILDKTREAESLTVDEFDIGGDGEMLGKFEPVLVQSQGQHDIDFNEDDEDEDVDMNLEDMGMEIQDEEDMDNYPDSDDEEFNQEDYNIDEDSYEEVTVEG
jgi:DNA-directed RNA polymerase subunit beta'